ncbi:hypothetical protein NMG60_11019043 [Bertholletia excelsa]
MDSASCFNLFIQNSSFVPGFLVFGCFGEFFNVVGILLLLRLGLKVLTFWSSSKNFPDGKPKLMELWKNARLEENERNAERKGDAKSNMDSNGEYDGDGETKNERGCRNEDQVFDLLSLRKLVKIERQRAEAAYLELEKERAAATTAAEEAMAMILRLQSEKSSIEMEANQYRRLAEEKQVHDREVIQSLRWIVMKHESERSVLEDELRFLRRRLKLYVKGAGGDETKVGDDSQTFFNSNLEDSAGDALVSSLDIDLSPL